MSSSRFATLAEFIQTHRNLLAAMLAIVFFVISPSLRQLVYVAMFITFALATTVSLGILLVETHDRRRAATHLGICMFLLLGIAFVGSESTSSEPEMSNPQSKTDIESGRGDTQVSSKLQTPAASESKPAQESANEKQSLERLESLASQGSARAQVELGERYLTGDGVEKDLYLAKNWISKAANQKYPHGIYLLGTFYENGIAGIDRSTYRAGEFYLTAAGKNQASAMEKVIEGYRFGRFGIGQSDSSALTWATRAEREHGARFTTVRKTISSKISAQNSAATASRQRENKISSTSLNRYVSMGRPSWNYNTESFKYPDKVYFEPEGTRVYKRVVEGSRETKVYVFDLMLEFTNTLKYRSIDVTVSVNGKSKVTDTGFALLGKVAWGGEKISDTITVKVPPGGKKVTKYYSLMSEPRIIGTALGKWQPKGTYLTGAPVVKITKMR